MPRNARQKQITYERRRKVWAILSDEGWVPSRALAKRLGCHYRSIHYDMEWLEGAGYIERRIKGGTAVRVLIPLLTIGG